MPTFHIHTIIFYAQYIVKFRFSNYKTFGLKYINYNALKKVIQNLFGKPD